MRRLLRGRGIIVGSLTGELYSSGFGLEKLFATSGHDNPAPSSTPALISQLYNAQLRARLVLVTLVERQRISLLELPSSCHRESGLNKTVP